MVDFAYDICTLGESLIDTLFITKDRKIQFRCMEIPEAPR